MIEELKELAILHGDKLELVPIDRLHTLREELLYFQHNNSLNAFQNQIIDKLYKLELTKEEEIYSSIIIVAIPHPLYALVDFKHKNKEYRFKSLLMSDFERTENYLNKALSKHNFSLSEQPMIPLKRLAVRSGLATYGRNNITYIENMGSCYSLMAYFSDIPCSNRSWESIEPARQCDKCKICINICPTGAIHPEKFLIDNEKCLTFLNEDPKDFPDWLSPSAHHCVFDCLKCQRYCPMNKGHIEKVGGPFLFNQDETKLLMKKKKLHEFPLEMQYKVNILGMYEWLDAIPRNLKVLMELTDKGKLKE